MVYYERSRKALCGVILYFLFIFPSGALCGAFFRSFNPSFRRKYPYHKKNIQFIVAFLSQLLEVVFFLSRWDYIRGYLGLEKVGLEHTDDDLTNKEKYDTL